MSEYLALHNMTLLDFWICFGLWMVGAVLIYLLIRMWVTSLKKYRDDKSFIGLFTLVVLVILVFIGPVMFMGLWHFIHMLFAVL